jgi:hypothetical protein
MLQNDSCSQSVQIKKRSAGAPSWTMNADQLSSIPETKQQPTSNSWKLFIRFRNTSLLKVKVTAINRSKQSWKKWCCKNHLCCSKFSVPRNKKSCFPVKKQIHWGPGSSVAVWVTVKMCARSEYSVFLGARRSIQVIVLSGNKLQYTLSFLLFSN